MRSIHDLFNDKKLREKLLSIRLPLGLALAALVVYFVNPAWFPWALAVSITGTALQSWCFGSIKTHKVLAVRGPYLFVRNPMYLSRFLVLFGALLFTGNVWVVGIFVPLYYLYMVNRVKREERKLRQIFGADYESYCEDVRPFFPTLKRLNANHLWFFRWEYFLRNHGPFNIVTMIVFYAACSIAAVRAN